MRLKKHRSSDSAEVSRRIRPDSSNPGGRRAGAFSYYSTGATARDSAKSASSTDGVSRRDTSRRRVQWRYVPGALAAVVIIGCLLYNAFLTTVPRVIVTGTPTERVLLQDSEVYQQAAAEVLREKWSQRLKLTFEAQPVRSALLAAFPELADVEVSLPLVGNRPVLRVEPAMPTAVFVASHGQSYVLSGAGRTISSNVTSAFDELPLITDRTGLVIASGAQAVPRSDVMFIQEVQRQLAAQSIRVQSFTLPQAARQLDVSIEGQRYYVKFSLEADVRLQAGAYIAVQKQLAEEGKSPREYIDVRVAGRAYYR